jgi:hypothetical protein
MAEDERVKYRRENCSMNLCTVYGLFTFVSFLPCHPERNEGSGFLHVAGKTWIPTLGTTKRTAGNDEAVIGYVRCSGLSECQFFGALCRLYDSLDQRDAQLPFLEFHDRVDGAAGGRCDCIFQ